MTSFTKAEFDELLELLQAKLKECKNLFGINFVNNSLDDTEKGKEILEVLDRRQGKRMRYYLTTGETATYNKTKIMILGDGGVGKTCTLNSLLGKAFNSKHVSTLVGDIKIDVKVIENDLWKQDERIEKEKFTAFDEDLTDMTSRIGSNMFMSRKQKIIVYEEDNVTKMFRRKTKKKNVGQVLSKTSDSKNKIVKYQTRRKSIIAQFLEPVTLNIWDFGGQKVFDTLHHIFLTEGGVCFLVFSLPKLIKNEKVELQKLRAWLKSIYVYARNAKVFLIGTNALHVSAIPPKALKGVDKCIRKLSAEFSLLLIVKNDEKFSGKEKFSDGNEPLHFFRVENNSKLDANLRLINLLKKAISHETSFDFDSVSKKQIPLAWTFLMQKVVEKENKITSIQEMFAVGERNGFKISQLIELSSFFSKSGAILNFRDRFEKLKINKIDEKKNVVLDPQWLLKKLATFIFDNELHENLMEKYEAISELSSFCDLYEDHGILTEKLLRKLLKDNDCSSEETDFIITLATEMLVMSRLPKLPKSIETVSLAKTKNKFYIVPSMIPLKVITGNQASNTSGHIEWNDVLPNGFFQNFCCSFCHFALESSSYRPLHFTTHSMLIEYNGFEMLIKRDELHGKYLVASESQDTTHLESLGEIFKKVGTQLKILLYPNDKLVGKLYIKHSKKTFELTSDADNKEQEEVSSTENEIKYDCFIAHEWGDWKENHTTHQKAKQLKDILVTQQLKVWLDEDNLGNNVQTGIAKGLKQSAVIIILLTEKYFQRCENKDTNAHKEFVMATKKGLDWVVPLVMDVELLNPNDWLYGVVKLGLADTVWTAYATPEQQKNNLEGIVDKIKKLAALKAQVIRTAKQKKV